MDQNPPLTSCITAYRTAVRHATTGLRAPSPPPDVRFTARQRPPRQEAENTSL